MMITIREESELKEFVVTTNSEFARVGRKGIIFKLSTETLLLTFSSDQVLKVFCVDKCKLLTSWNFLKDSNNFSDSVVKIREDKSSSVFRWHRFWHRREKYFNQKYFSERTEDSSASQYFQFYGYLSQQQNMMQDFIRTSTYQKAILDNPADFNGKVVLDVGAGKKCLILIG